MNRNRYLTEKPHTVVQAEKEAAEKLQKEREAKRDKKKLTEAAENFEKIQKQKIKLRQIDTPAVGYGGCGAVRGGCGS